MKKVFGIFLLFFLMNCGFRQERVKPEPQVSVFVKQTRGFGPWMMPLAGRKNSIRIIYVTGNPEPTDLYFSMAGDVDWTRWDSEKVRLHRMDFENLEYSARYDFQLESKDPGILKNFSHRTQAWGRRYRFSFAVSDPTNLNRVSRGVDFIIVTDSFDEETFFSFYSKHASLLKETLFVPTGSLFLNQKNIGFVRNGAAYWDYRDYRILILNEQASDFRRLSFLFGTDQKMLVICDHADPKLVRRLFRIYGDRIQYLITTKDLRLKDQILVKGISHFQVEKKFGRKTAMREPW